jgi:site-specific DNA recombinase
MVTTAPATIMTLTASGRPGPGLPPGLARPPGPAMPDVPVGVALALRTSTLEMQDPVASMRRQVRNSEASLPPGFQVVAWYWDVESGAIDLADRSQGEAWQQVAAELGLPRDGGLADLLTDAARPDRRFAVVVCEDISRVARDNLASLMVEKDLARHGIPIFAADEPASLEGASPTTILVRRIKQGTSEFYRLQMLDLCWDGLVQHAIDGWNIGKAPYGYLPDRHQHPAALKAAQGLTRTRLIPDPERGPVVTQIFHWRTVQRLSVPTIAWKLNADPDAYPPPGNAPGWTEPTVSAILRNPKYTGYMVYGRTRAIPGAKPRQRGSRKKRPARPVPPDQWIWSPEPRHEPLTSLATWPPGRLLRAWAPSAATSATPRSPPPSPAPATRCGPGSGTRPASTACTASAAPPSPRPPPARSTPTTTAPTTPPTPATSPPTPATKDTPSQSAKKPSSPPSPASWTSTSSATTAPPCSPPPSPPTTPTTPPPATAKNPGSAPNSPASTPPRPAS